MKQIVNRISEKKIKRGVCQLLEQDFVDKPTLDCLVHLYGVDNRFLAQAYLSRENKGIGWVYSTTKQPLTLSFFTSLFEKAKEKRNVFFHSEQTTAFRLFHQDGDGFGGMTIDCYGEFAVFSWYNSFIYQQKNVIIEAFKQVFPTILGAYEKNRFTGAGFESRHVYGQEAPATFVVLENGVRYQVFLNDGLMTGIFLDQHDVRGVLVDGLASGKTLLNMFSYTAAFSIAAAMGGVSRTTSVDLAKRSRELSQAHFDANGIETGQEHQFVVMDVFDYFKYAKRKGLSYDIIVLDPPSFARNKKQTFSVSKDYHRLIAESLDILNPDGIIIASTNAANFSKEAFRQEIEKGFAGRKHTYLSLHRLPSDFVYNTNDESSNYLKVFTIQVQS